MIIELRESYTQYNLMTNKEEFTMARTFKAIVKISGKGISNYDNENGITTFKMKGNKNSSTESIVNNIKKTLSKTNCKLEEVIEVTETTEGTATTEAVNTTTTTATATKTTKTTKKAATETVTVLLRTFTGLKIGTYTGKLDSKKQVITIHIGRVGDVEFNLDGTQKTINPSKNPKFNNRIEIIAEA